MRGLAPRVFIVLTLGIGGTSLIPFTYFLLFGTPFPLTIMRTDAARLAWDGALCFVFFIQHSSMIRRGFRERAGRRVPAMYQPAVYSIASGIVLYALVLLWQPTSHFVFHLDWPARWVSIGIIGLAMAGLAWGAHSLESFDAFGTAPLKPALRDAPAPSAVFVARGAYRFVRHPLYLFMLLLIWSTPRFTTDQLLFNVLWTAWIIVAIRLEERDLLAAFGNTYREYQASVPMLVPSSRSIGIGR